MKDMWTGYYLMATFLRNNTTNMIEKVYILKDVNKLIGYFSDNTFADRFWLKEYLPSHRTKISSKLDQYSEVKKWLIVDDV